MNFNNFSMEDLIEFGIQYYEILGSYTFKEKFVKPLGNEIITQIVHKVNLSSPLSNHKILSNNKQRIGFINRVFFNQNSTSTIINESQIPIIDYSNPIIRFIDIKHRKEKATKEDREILKACIEFYIKTFGHEDYFGKIEELIFQIFKISTQRFSELFQGYKKRVNYISNSTLEIEKVKRQIQLEFSILNKQQNSPFIIVFSRIVDINWEWIEIECNYIIYQSKTYLTNNEKNSAFFITHDENLFMDMVRKIPTDNTYVRVEFFHKNPRTKKDPNTNKLIDELQRKAANTNQIPNKNAA
ncbi:MAG: hypothetical protein LAT82_00735 [Nanoarchaeota archaeon]|nr:hypothetical protein [Nanoarchaeota archaeon]